MSAAVSAGAAAVISANTMIQRQADIRLCKAIMPPFTDATATVEQRQQYAHCVDVMHPNPMNGYEIAGLVVLGGLTCAMLLALTYMIVKDAIESYKSSQAMKRLYKHFQ